MFSIDGVQWAYPCDIERTAEMKASDISGLMMDKSYFNDVLGTYMGYEVKISVPFGKEPDYHTIYEMLTQPIDGHAFVFPYNGSTVSITGRVGEVKDTWYRDGEGQFWQSVKFSVEANHPTKTMSLSEVITRGRTPFPDAASVETGTIWQKSSASWNNIVMTDGHYYEWTESTKTLADAQITDGDEVAY